MIQHYSGPVGTFDYDDELWEMVDINAPVKVKRLRWIGGNQVCDLPKGCTSCIGMFECVRFREGFKFGDFDTSKITDMSSMFSEAVIPDGFSLGDNFDTSNVIKMYSMFIGARVQGDLNLGDKFNTQNVEHMNAMFQDVEIKGDLILGDSFYTNRCESVDRMFYHCNISGVVHTGIYFDLSVYKSEIFGDAILKGEEISEFSSVKSLQEWKYTAIMEYLAKEHTSYRADAAQLDKQLRDILVKWLAIYYKHLTVFNEELLNMPMTHEDYMRSEFAKGALNLLSASPGIIPFLPTADSKSVDESTSFYNFAKLADVPQSTLKFCSSVQDLQEVIDKYCKL